MFNTPQLNTTVLGRPATISQKALEQFVVEVLARGVPAVKVDELAQWVAGSLRSFEKNQLMPSAWAQAQPLHAFDAIGVGKDTICALLRKTDDGYAVEPFDPAALPADYHEQRLIDEAKRFFVDLF